MLRTFLARRLSFLSVGQQLCFMKGDPLRENTSLMYCIYFLCVQRKKRSIILVPSQETAKYISLLVLKNEKQSYWLLFLYMSLTKGLSGAVIQVLDQS